MNKLQHLTEAYYHLMEVPGFELECHRIKSRILDVLKTNTEDLTGADLIDRLSDEELAIAIRIRDPRLKIYVGSHIDPFMFNYVRRERPQVAAIEFSRKR